MISRVTDADELIEVINETSPSSIEGVNMRNWMSDYDNIALKSNGSFSVFTWDGPGKYTGHYFFRCHGKEAKALALEMLDEMFSVYKAKMICGLTPVEHRGALWMNKQIGFTGYNVIQTEAGPHQLFILTKDEYEKVRH